MARILIVDDHPLVREGLRRVRLMKKLGCSSASELTRFAIREGIVKP